MKKLFFIAILLIVNVSIMAQQNIQLRSVDKAECVKSDMTNLKASFSFSTIEARDFESERGTFSWLSLPNTIIGGNEGDPQIPVINELIAVPFGATPRIEIMSYSSTDYRLDDYGIHTLAPRQPSLRKDQKPEDVPFVYNEATYQSTRGFRGEPMAVVGVEGIMRGIQLGKMTIEPVSYDPVNNILRVFNDIEVEVHFDGADDRATEQMLVDTYSPCFDIVYKQMFNGRAILDAYSAHPDLYTTPVKMLVVTTSKYSSCSAFQNWLTWKTQKGIDVDVQTVANGVSASAVQSLIHSKYNTNHPTFLVIVGDKEDVTSYETYNTGAYDPYDSDLPYASVDGDVYHDMYMSRMPVSSTAELGYLVDKILEYEKYTMPDPSYLNDVLLIAGADGFWEYEVGRPTINYAANYYFNTEHGFNNIYKYVTSNYTGCYDYLSSGVGFVNYTAHGDIYKWYEPEFNTDDAAALTNTDKYFWAMGNCCLAANWGNSEIPLSLAEALLRGQNKGAFGYIGSIPETYWYEDYFFGVGATTTFGQMPAMASTKTGAYDAMFDDSGFNTLNAVPFLGNVAVSYAHANSDIYEHSVSDLYYWRAYQCLGDGSVMPYHVKPAVNNVSHASTLGIGMSTFTVIADAGSYVAITKDNEILGVAQVDETGIANVPITPVTTTGEVLVVVTRNQRQPHIQIIQAEYINGPSISINSYSPNTVHVGEDTELSISFTNVGTAATSGTTTVTLTSDDPNVTIEDGVKTFNTLAVNAEVMVNGFTFLVDSSVADGERVSLHYQVSNGGNTWEGELPFTTQKAVLQYRNMNLQSSFVPGETLTITARFKNIGHYQATHAVAMMNSSSEYVRISNPTITVGTLEVDEEVSCQFNVTILASCPESAQLPVTFSLTADGGLSAQGTATLENYCNVVFELNDTWGDGWDGAMVTVGFDDGTPSQNLTVEIGHIATYTIGIKNGTHVTLSWTSGAWDYECSFTVRYEENDIYIFEQGTSPDPGVLYEFDCRCGMASLTFAVNVSANNDEYGTVTGEGWYDFGQICVATAIPTEGHYFTNWTRNGVVVSRTPEYAFEVDNNIDLVANFAEGFLVGDGKPNTSTDLPSYDYWKYNLSQQIYTVAELGGAGVITCMAFYNGGDEMTRNYDFYLKSTTKDSFSNNTDWVSVSSADKVFSGNVTMVADAWTIITLSSQFAYDGASNVVLVADDNTNDATTLNDPHMLCRVFNAPNQALFVRNDNTNFDPGTPSSYEGTLSQVKNQIVFTKVIPSTDPVIVTVSANPARAGVVSGGGSYVFGETCTVSVTPNEGYFFTGWTENGVLVSSDLSFSFMVASERNLVANFFQAIEIGTSATNSEYLPSYNYYKQGMSQQIYTAAEIGRAGVINSIAFYNEGAEKTRNYDFYLKATSKLSFNNNTDWIAVAASDKVFSGEVTMVSNAWTIITLNTPFAYDGTSNIVLVADDNTNDYSLEPHMFCSVFSTSIPQALYVCSDSEDYDPVSPPTSYSYNNETLSVKNHILLGVETEAEAEQIVTLTQGWNWWSTNLDITLDQLKDALAAAVGTNGTAIIKSQGGTITCQNGQWRPTNLDFDIKSMYQIYVNTNCEITLSGTQVNPSEYEITIYNGINWIGFLPNESMTLNEAFGSFPVEGDMVKSEGNSATYTGGIWRPAFDLEPGKGYIYQSNAQGNRTFTYGTNN